jgi:hypothetical protein
LTDFQKIAQTQRKKRLIILVVILSVAISAFAQNDYVLHNMFDLNLKFKMSPDTDFALYEIDCDDRLDTLTVSLNGRKKKLRSFVPLPYIRECLYPGGQIQSFLSARNLSDSFYVFLDFYSNRLISFDVYLKSAPKKSYVDSLLIKEFGYFGKRYANKDIDIRMSRTEGDFYSISISDRRASKFVPPWCGNSKKRGSWAKLEKYLNSVEKKHKKRKEASKFEM